MSNYRGPAFNPVTGKVDHAAYWLDNHFGMHTYGVRFEGSDKVYRQHEIGIEAAEAEIERLRTALVEACDIALGSDLGPEHAIRARELKSAANEQSTPAKEG